MTNLSVKLLQLPRNNLQSLPTLAAFRAYRSRILHANLAEFNDIRRIARKSLGPKLSQHPRLQGLKSEW